MTVARPIASLSLLLLLTTGAFAQETATAETTTPADTAATAAEATAVTTTEEKAAEKPVDAADETRGNHELRSRFVSLVYDHPAALATVLRLEPSLLKNESFLASYPELARFVAAHPEIPRNPHFYVAEFPGARREDPFAEQVLEGMLVSAIFVFIAFVLAWVVRTIVEQKRWSRLSKTQSEVHNKILDRFSTSEELLAYVRSPAGTKFLESAPIAVSAAPAVQRTPMSRMIWSIQLGVIVGLGALGMFLVSLRFDGEAAHTLFALGVIAFFVGVGFILSAVVSMTLSRRMGLLGDEARPSTGLEDPGVVR